MINNIPSGLRDNTDEIHRNP